jgi:hypothetical protein
MFPGMKYWFIFFFTCSALFASAQKPTASETELRKQADKYFSNSNYPEATPLYSQLLSLFPHDPILNYRYGVSLMESGKEKTPAIVYLDFATKNQPVPEEAWLYLGKAHMIGNNYSKAFDAFTKYKSIAQSAKSKKAEIDLLIANSQNAIVISKDRKDAAIINSREVKRNSFYSAYDFSETSGKLVPTAAMFLTTQDKDKQMNPMMFISKDGQLIYYSSYGRGGSSGKDIYMVRKMVNGQWGTPENLGTIINSDENEDFPYIDRDGRTLYFCSRGHNSIGGYDVFKSVFDYNTNQWSAPENLGIPINTVDDDIFYVPTLNGDKATYSTAYESNLGNVNVRQLSLGDAKNRFAIISGTYFSLDQATRRDARITVLRTSDKAIVNSVHTDPKSGRYELVLPAGNDYTLIVEGGGYLPHAEQFSLPDLAVAGMRQEVKLNKDKEQERMTVSNYFTPLSTKLDEPVLAFRDSPTTVSTSSISKSDQDSSSLIPVRLNDQVVYINDPKAKKYTDESFVSARAKNVATYGYDENISEAQSAAEEENENALPSIKLAERDRYDPTLEKKMSDDEIRQIEEERERAQIVEEEEKNPSILIDFNIDNDELAQIALEDARSLQEEAEKMKERASSMKANASLQDSLALSLEEQAESMDNSDPERKTALKMRASELKEESYSLNRQASDLQLQASIKMDESRAARNDAEGILRSSGRKAELLAKAEKTPTEKTKVTSTVQQKVDKGYQDNIDVDQIPAEEQSTALATEAKVSQKSDDSKAQKQVLNISESDSPATNTSVNSNTTDESGFADSDTQIGQKSDDAQSLSENAVTDPVSMNSQTSSNPEPGSTSKSDDNSSIQSENALVVNKEKTDQTTRVRSDADNTILRSDEVKLTKEIASADKTEQHANQNSAENSKTASEISTTTSSEIAESTPASAPVKHVSTAPVDKRTPAEIESVINQTKINASATPNSNTASKQSTLNSELPDTPQDIDQNSHVEQLSAQNNPNNQESSELREDPASTDKGIQKDELVSGNSTDEVSDIAVASTGTKDADKNAGSTAAQDLSGSQTDKIKNEPNTVSKNAADEALTESSNLRSNPTITEAANESITESPRLGSDKPKTTTADQSSLASDSKVSGSNTQAENSASDNKNIDQSETAANTSGKTASSADLNKTKSTSKDERPLDANKSDDLQSDESSLELALATPKTTEIQTGNSDKSTLKTLAELKSSDAISPSQREKFIVPESKKAEIQAEARIVYESYEKNIESSETLFKQSRTLQDRVLEMPRSPERDSLLQVSNSLSRESGRQYDIAQSQLADAIQMDTKLSEILVRSEAVITDDTKLALNSSNTQSTISHESSENIKSSSSAINEAGIYTPDATQPSAQSSGSKSVTQESNVLADSGDPDKTPATDAAQTDLEESGTDPATESAHLTENKNASTLADQKNLDAKIASTPTNNNNTKKKSTVANPNEPLRRAGEEQLNTVNDQEIDQTNEQLASGADIINSEKGNPDKIESVAVTETTKPKSTETQSVDPLVTNTYTNTKKEESARTTALIPNAPSLSSEEILEKDVKEGINVNHPKYPEYKQVQTEITNSQVETINLFAEGVNLNKQAVEEKQRQVDLMDSAQKIEDPLAREAVLQEAEDLGIRSDRNQELSKEKLNASQAKTHEVKALTRNMESLKQEMASSPASAMNTTNKEGIKSTASQEINNTGANKESLAAKMSAGEAASMNNTSSAGTLTTTTSTSTFSPVELEKFSVEMYSKSRGPAYTEVNPIPLNPGLPEGLVFKVQIGAFRKPIPDNTFKNLQPISAETSRPGWLRYCVGMFKTFEPANLVKKELQGTGYKDAFVVAYFNGERVSLQEANAILNRQENQLAYTGEMQKEIAVLRQLNVIPQTSRSGPKDNDEQMFYGNATAPSVNIPVATEELASLQYSVQVGVYRTANPPVILNSLEPLYTEALPRGLYRFTSGRYAERSAAESAKTVAVQAGVSDAFVVAVRGTKNVSIPARTVIATEKVSEPVAEINEPLVKAEKTEVISKAGLHFKVQLGAFRQNVPFETVEAFLKISDKGIVRLTDERGLNIFYAGDFDNFEAAKQLREEIIEKGVKDAFVVVLSNGKRIPLSDVLNPAE